MNIDNFLNELEMELDALLVNAIKDNNKRFLFINDQKYSPLDVIKIIKDSISAEGKQEEENKSEETSNEYDIEKLDAYLSIMRDLELLRDSAKQDKTSFHNDILLNIIGRAIYNLRTFEPRPWIALRYFDGDPTEFKAPVPTSKTSKQDRTDEFPF